jgi:hypothetical protein
VAEELVGVPSTVTVPPTVADPLSAVVRAIPEAATSRDAALADLANQITAKLNLPTPPHSHADPFSHLAAYRSLEKVARLAEVERRMAVLSAIGDQRHLTEGEAEAWYRLKRSLRALTEA